MCGLAGIWYRDGQAVNHADLKRMADTLRHRGPDGEGFWRENNIGFCHRRLSILDVSARGTQPMSTPDGQLHLVFNGAIHNYIELKRELQALGIVFVSDTDTEVALWAYRVWGKACFERFNGMWAMAIWNSEKQELLLVRDRFGIKPLYYSIRSDRIAFASEAKAILGVFREESTINEDELLGFLHGATTDTSDCSFFRNIFQILPGHMLIIRRDTTHTKKYWSFVPGTEVARPDIEEEFLALLDDAVGLRLRSDIPVAAMVSGGLDSSSVALLAAARIAEPMQTFSLKYDDPAIDESHYASMVLEKSGNLMPHFFQPPRGPLLETIRRTTWHHDAPCPSRGRYAAWHLMQETARYSHVILTGEGGDEILAGYGRFILDAMMDRWQLESASGSQIKKELDDLTAVTGESISHLVTHRMKQKLFTSILPVVDVLTPDVKSRYRKKKMSDSESPYRSRLNNSLWHEFTVSGLPEVLHHFDACTMAFGIEGRAPLLDHRIVELMFSLPFNEKIRDGWTKSLLRRAMKNILPEPIRLRRHKLGYPAPLNAMYRIPAHATEIKSCLLDGEGVRQGWFDRKSLERKMVTRLQPGRSNNPEVLWRLLSTEFWLRDFIADNSDN
jgi:asparagine synthase (glutamine-hydrolysing)